MVRTAGMYDASDLSTHGRPILDQARTGEALIRDQDSFGLLMLSEQRVQALRAVARAAFAVLAIVVRAA